MTVCWQGLTCKVSAQKTSWGLFQLQAANDSPPLLAYPSWGLVILQAASSSPTLAGIATTSRRKRPPLPLAAHRAGCFLGDAGRLLGATNDGWLPSVPAEPGRLPVLFTGAAAVLPWWAPMREEQRDEA